MLGEIGADPAGGLALEDPCDPRFLSGDCVELRLRGHARDELFPLLKVVLSARFAHVPRRERAGDLLGPLRHALGNAFKHGNRGDRGRTILVEIAAGVRGAVLAVTDEGQGFEVEPRVQRLASEPRSSRGAGLRALARSRSRVGWEGGGRTVLIGFSPARVEAARPGAEPRPNRARALEEELGRLCGLRGARCLAYEEAGAEGEPSRIRYVVRGEEDGRVATAILCGRLFASEGSARADFEAARLLHAGVRGKRLRIPRPLARPRSRPRLVIYAFDPWLDLAEYVAQREDPEGIARCARRLGVGLRAVHEAAIALREERWEERLERERARGALLIAELGAADPERARRLRALLAELLRRAERLPRRPAVPVHGAFGWSCVQYGADGRFYLEGFGESRLSHPGLDVGGLLADLPCVAAACGAGEVTPRAREAFLEAYRAGAPPARWLDDLPLFVGLAVVERIERALRRGVTSAEALEALLSRGESALGTGL
jgi:hypothetical protein